MGIHGKIDNMEKRPSVEPNEELAKIQVREMGKAIKLMAGVMDEKIDQTTILPPRPITQKDLLNIADEIENSSCTEESWMFRKIANAIRKVINKRVE